MYFCLKLLLLSATPMFDKAREIVWLLNLMNLNDNRFRIRESDIFDANDFIKLIIPVLGGKGGGGRNTLAQGGGSSPENSKEAVKVLIEEIEKKLAS